MPVKWTRSTKSTVTIRRSSPPRSWPAIARPHDQQSRASAGFIPPHRAHAGMCGVYGARSQLDETVVMADNTRRAPDGARRAPSWDAVSGARRRDAGGCSWSGTTAPAPTATPRAMPAPMAASDQLKPLLVSLGTTTGVGVTDCPPPPSPPGMADADAAKLSVATAAARASHLRILRCLRRIVASLPCVDCLISTRLHPARRASASVTRVTLVV
jgi:hypothetical protein